MAFVYCTMWVGVAIGHTALMIGGVNQWYGRPLPHRLLSVIRGIHALLVPAVLLGLWLVYGWHIDHLFESSRHAWLELPVALYVAVCCGVTYLGLPAVTVFRLLRRARPLLENHTRTVCMADRLDFKPVGHGKYRSLARLPFNEVFQIDFAEKVLQLPKLPPALKGITILHLSDLHFCGTPDLEFYIAAMDICRDWQPDILAITGDVVDSDHHHRWILPVLNRLRWNVGAFAILGNHDTWHAPNLVRRRLRRLGIQVLGNSWQVVTVHESPVIFIGNEAPWIRPAPKLAHCPTDGFRICLSHTPDNMPWAKSNDIDLVLAGHNHGGQIRVPGFGSILVPSRFGRRYDCGVFEEGSTVMHVVRGVAAQHPLRYFCRPEIARLTLRNG